MRGSVMDGSGGVSEMAGWGSEGLEGFCEAAISSVRRFRCGRVQSWRSEGGTTRRLQGTGGGRGGTVGDLMWNPSQWAPKWRAGYALCRALTQQHRVKPKRCSTVCEVVSRANCERFYVLSKGGWRRKGTKGLLVGAMRRNTKFRDTIYAMWDN